MRVILALVAAVAAAAAPSVSKVDPPNWWAGHSINPVRLLIRGTGLGGAQVKSGSHDLRIGKVRANAAGTYLFVDVHIAPDAKPGMRDLRIATGDGSAAAHFAIAAPLARAGRFQGFSSDDVMYLIMPDRFADGDARNDDPAESHGLYDRGKARYYHGGDLRGVIDHLPYLKDLGVTAIWLNPLYDNSNQLNRVETYNNQAITDYHGYGAVDFYAVDEHFGDLGLLRRFVDEAHRAGIKVILDMVANHTGPYHPWVNDSPTPTWYNGTRDHHAANTWQTWTLQDPHSLPAMRKTTLEGWFLNILPDLNQNDPECARYIVQNTLWWLGVSGIDGIRQDTLPYVPRSFWRDWMAAIKREYPDVRVVGELFDADPVLVSFFQGGRTEYDGIDDGIDSVFDFPSYYHLRAAFANGRGMRELQAMLARDYLYPRADLLVDFLGLHDVPRFMSEPGATVDGLKLAFTYLMTTRGLPLIYYGDEVAMRGGGDPENRRDFPGGWPGDAHNAFEESGRTPPERAVFDHVRTLARLRAACEPLRRGRLVNLSATEQVWVYLRQTPKQNVVVAINNGPESVKVTVPPLGALHNALPGPAPAARPDGTLEITLPARTSAVLVP